MYLSRLLNMHFLILIVSLSKILSIVLRKDRHYCIGRVDEDIMTVRFTYRGNVVRIYGAGYWRKGRKIYEEQD